MEKTLNIVGSLWISKKAKVEIFNITEDLCDVAEGGFVVGSAMAIAVLRNYFTTNGVHLWGSSNAQSLSSTIEDKAKWVINKLKGKTQKPLPELLRDYNLPAGLFPQNIICYEFDITRSKLIVYMPSPCEVCFKDTSIVRYANRVKATLSKGKLMGVEGVKTKLLVWVKVSSIVVESCKSDKIWFSTVGGVKKCRSKNAYEITCDAVNVDEF